ncbi:hypothetical protein TRSC58_00875 [Trypanosoma rangeli SC58]|uniref:Methyltransferase n=1 Tax=Trypanosoma rangeli SC58 TaxID=429131 RepID=A0A061JB83_TRYRA|nr:hypothetical protein TRSC58_00875 [Trypanosoma rangeli SC58]
MKTRCDMQFSMGEEKAELNQYWYSPHTIRALLAEVLHHATACAFLSTPSLYFALVCDPEGTGVTDASASVAGGAAAALAASSRLFEFDRQWEREPGFVHYDFHKPEQVPVQYLAAFDYILADPPFITEDVWTAYVQTARLLLRPGGKLLLTTVLENHTMLEGLLDAPLFIAPFRPAITNLTYQYVCFTSYKATRLAQVNSELPPEDPKIMAATLMANDLRESEREFTAQMRQRDRQGEVPLPVTQHYDAPSTDLADLPISAMKWGYIPAGLTVYANGDKAPPANSGDHDYGSVYREVEALRVMLDNFKRLIDLSQKHLDVLLRLQHKCKRQEEGEDSSAAETALLAAKEAFAKTLEEMRGIVTSVESSEARVAAESGVVAPGYISAMKECVEAYAAVPLQKRWLNELAADATRKFKSPVFNRMKELLQRLKEIKRQQSSRTVAADATPSS